MAKYLIIVSLLFPSFAFACEKHNQQLQVAIDTLKAELKVARKDYQENPSKDKYQKIKDIIAKIDEKVADRDLLLT